MNWLEEIENAIDDYKDLKARYLQLLREYNKQTAELHEAEWKLKQQEKIIKLMEENADT